MKINEIINEDGFWKSLAKGMAGRDIAHQWDAHTQNQATLAQARERGRDNALIPRKSAVRNLRLSNQVNAIKNQLRGNTSISSTLLGQIIANNRWAPPQGVPALIQQLSRGLQNQGITVTQPPSRQDTVQQQTTAPVAQAPQPALPQQIATMGKKGEPVDFSKMSPAAKAQLRAQGVYVPESKNNKDIVKEMAIRRAWKEREL